MDFWGKTKKVETNTTSAAGVTIKEEKIEKTYDSVFGCPVGEPTKTDNTTAYLPNISENVKTAGKEAASVVFEALVKNITGK